MTVLSPLPIQKFFDNNGRPLVGGLLFTYEAGTTNKLATYTDSSGLSLNTNPVVLDFRGEANVWLDPTLTYKFVLSPQDDTDPPTRPILTEDNVAGGLTVNELTQQFIGRVLYPRTQEEINAGVTPLNYAYPPGYLLRYLVSFVSNTTDCTTGLQNMLSVMRESPGVMGVLPAGIILYTTTLAFSVAGMTMVGQGNVMTVLKKNANFVGLTITAANTLSNFTLDSAGGSDANAGITVRSQARCYWHDLIVQNHGSHGVWLQQTSLSLFVGIQSLDNSGDGFRLDAGVAPIDANSYVIANQFRNIDCRGNGGVGFRFLKTAFSNMCDGIVSQNNTGNGIVLDNARGNFVVGYAENNGGPIDWLLTSDSECRGNTCYSVQGGFVDNSPSGGIYNTLWSANRAGTYDAYARRISTQNLIIPEDSFSGSSFQGTLSLTHTANRQFDFTADGFSGSQTVRFLNAQSGGIDFLTDRFEGNTIRLKAVAPTVSAGQVGLGSTTASTVGAAGGAAALPANPTGYWIINITGANFKIPYYAV